MNKLRIVKVLVGMPLIVLTFVLLSLGTASASQWIKTYAYGDEAHYANSIQQTSDGGYAVAGYTQSFSVGGSDAWVLKLDGNGNVQWDKKYGGTGTGLADANSIQQTSDGGYVVAGRAIFYAGHEDAWVLKLDGNGNVQWQKTYGGTGLDVANSIQQTSDGGYVVAGWTDSFGAEGDEWVLKLDGNGNIYNCSIVETSNAQVSNTDATVQDNNMIGIDTNISPQISTASVSNTNAIVTELCKYGCNLVPVATTIPRGRTLELQATVTNNTDKTVSVLAATKVTLPNGIWYPSSGFLFGPLSVYLGSYASKSGHLSHDIPLTAPLGIYTYHGYVGNYGPGNYSECQFNFEVTQP